MHPAVQLRALKGLPLPVRRLGLAACEDHSTCRLVERVRDYLVDHQRELLEQQKNAFLPVFFHNLDPEMIPSSTALEAADWPTRHTILRALISLDALSNLRRLPGSVGISLWPRVWHWTLFIITYRNNLPDPVPYWPIFNANFITFTSQFHFDPDTWALISSTPGFRTVISGVWRVMPDIEEPFREFVFGALSRFISDLEAGQSASLDEFIEGAGGSIHALAQLVLQYMRLVGQRESPLLADSRAADISALVSFVRQVDQHHEDDEEWLYLQFSSLSTALVVSHGIEMVHITITKLIGTVDAAMGIRPCLMFLLRMLISPHGFRSLAQALRKGLLQTLITCATIESADLLLHRIGLLFRVGISMGLAFHDNVVELENSLLEINPAAVSESLENSPLSGDWQAFSTFAQDRVSVLKSEEHKAPSRMCDNLQCGYIGMKASFKRCSGCRSLYYCSSACQKVGWAMGGHRAACASYGTLILHETSTDFSLGVRDRDFLRALVHREYKMHIDTVCAGQIKFLASSPESSVLLTFFDCGTPPLKIEVHSAHQSSLQRELVKLSGDEYLDLLARAQTSKGSMHLHVLRIIQGAKFRHLVIPLRFVDSELWDAMGSFSVDDMYDAEGRPTEAYSLLLDKALTAIHS
ncbi:hypothetical protein R3P38DRAFT_3098368 [Favolaschia claudopus]|uniref:MYND-type domain-containing protein n=1 Tax=Favolaschia claudopus TaxID=2862362 RepID=A0AAV9ZNX7_9AGAR